MYFQCSPGPDDKIGVDNFLSDRPLGFQALPALAGIPAALPQAPGLRRRRTRNTDGRIQLRLSPRFKQQGNNHGAAGAPVSAPGVGFGDP